MTETELLTWVRGPGFQIATIIFVLGIILRLFEILMLGRKANLAEAKGSEMSSGLRTVFSRTIPDASTFKRSAFTVTAGYIFHIGLFVVIFLFAPQGHHRFRLACAAFNRDRRHCGHNHHYSGYRTGTPIERPGETLPQQFR